MQIPKTRKDAIYLGVKFYNTGRTCKNGHQCDRHIGYGCVDCLRLIQQDYRKRNQDKIQKKNSNYKKNNATKIAELNKSYREKNRSKRNYQNKKYKIQSRQASQMSLTEWDELVISEAYLLSQARTKETGFDWHVDHMIPLRAKYVSGLHCANNIQVIPAIMNLSKRNKMILTEPMEWIKTALQ